MPLQSFQILHQCFHPTFASSLKGEVNVNPGTEYVLVLEQQYRPLNKKTQSTVIHLNEESNYAIQNKPISEEDEDEESKGSFTSSKQSKRSKDRISFTYRELARFQRQQLGMTVGLEAKIEQELNSSNDSSMSVSRPGRQVPVVMSKPKPGATIKNLSTVVQIGNSKILNQLVEDDD